MLKTKQPGKYDGRFSYLFMIRLFVKSGLIADKSDRIIRVSHRRKTHPIKETRMPYDKSQDTTIVRAAIHPSIGVARVGNSEDEFYIGPEVVEPLPEPPGFYKDPKGALKREAARFRIYGYNASGEAVAELTADTADIKWTVHVANKKAAWYQFQLALDIPEAASTSRLNPEPSLLRNFTEVKREKLTIDPGPRSIRGRNKGGKEYSFDTGKFFEKEVYLGELRTDEM